MGRYRSLVDRITIAELAVRFCCGCEDTGFCPLRIMGGAPEHSIFSKCRFWENRQLPANPFRQGRLFFAIMQTEEVKELEE